MTINIVHRDGGTAGRLGTLWEAEAGQHERDGSKGGQAEEHLHQRVESPEKPWFCLFTTVPIWSGIIFGFSQVNMLTNVFIVLVIVSSIVEAPPTPTTTLKYFQGVAPTFENLKNFHMEAVIYPDSIGWVHNYLAAITTRIWKSHIPFSENTYLILTFIAVKLDQIIFH